MVRAHRAFAKRMGCPLTKASAEEAVQSAPSLRGSSSAAWAASLRKSGGGDSQRGSQRGQGSQHEERMSKRRSMVWGETNMETLLSQLEQLDEQRHDLTEQMKRLQGSKCAA